MKKYNEPKIVITEFSECNIVTESSVMPKLFEDGVHIGTTNYDDIVTEY